MEVVQIKYHPKEVYYEHRNGMSYIVLVYGDSKVEHVISAQQNVPIPCPCGEIPKNLLLVENGSKWAYACGDCCNEWHIEFRTFYNEIDSDVAMALAIEAWNLANRG